MAEPIVDPLTLALAELPGAAERLREEHVPDEHGRCRGCTMPGTGTPYAHSPCSLALLAESALKVKSARAVLFQR